MRLEDILARHRSLYLESGSSSEEESIPVSPPDRSRAARQKAGESAAGTEIRPAGPSSFPDQTTASVGEITYPEPPAPRSEPIDDPLERFTRVLRWNERLYTQPMEEEA